MFKRNKPTNNKAHTDDRLQQPTDSILLGYDTTTNEEVRLPVNELPGAHFLCIGSSGSGKTRFIMNLKRQCLDIGFPYTSIDNEGSLHEDGIDHLAWNPHLVEKNSVVEFNVGNPQPDMFPGLNLLARFEHSPWLSVLLEHVLAGFGKAWEEDSKKTPRLRRWLRNIIFVLIENGLSLAEAEYLVDLGESSIRRMLANKTTNRRAKRDLLQLDAMSVARQLEQIESLINRLAEFTDNETAKLVLSRTTNIFNPYDVIENGKSVEMNLSQEGGRLHQDSTFLISALFINMYISYFLTRPEDIAKEQPHLIILDEGHNYVSGRDINKFLDQGRKRAGSILYSGQHLNQVYEQDPWLYHSLLSNTKIKCVFSISDPADLAVLEESLFIGQHDLKKVKSTMYSGQEAVHAFLSIPEQRYQNQTLLHRQEPGYFLFKIGTQPPRLLRVPLVEPYPKDEAKRAHVRAMMRSINPNYYLSEAESLLQLEQRHQALEALEEQAESLSDFRSRA